MNIVFTKILEFGPAVIPLIEKVAKLGQDGIKYAQTFLDIKGKESEIQKKQKDIEDIYKNIGKIIYENKIVVNDLNIKDDIERIDIRINEIDKINNEVTKLNDSIKNNDKLKDLPDILTEIKEINSKDNKAKA